MPMIDVYAAAGTFDDKHALAQKACSCRNALGALWARSIAVSNSAWSRNSATSSPAPPVTRLWSSEPGCCSPSHLKVDGASTGTPTLAASSRRPPASNWLPEHNKALGLTSSPTAVAAGMPRHFGTSRARPARLAEQRGIDKGRVQDLPSVQFRLDVTPAVEPRPGTGHGGDRCSPVIRGAPCGAGGRIQPGAGLASRGAQVDVLTSSLVIQRATFSG
jgi:hypothetical protein